MIQTAAAFGLCLALQVSLNAAAGTRDEAEVRASVVRGHAEWCHRVYTDSAKAASALEVSVHEFVAHPTQAKLESARSSWITARKSYCLSEALRFCDGPIEAVEPLLNAWPIDEAYIDSVVGRPASGIINDTTRFPALGETVLLVANERGGETNVSVGWHAIEFMLWGQDLDTDGPGRRPFSDFVAGKSPHAERRGEYLLATTGLLERQLAELAAAWAPNRANYRRKFEADVDGALRKILTGCIVLTSFELRGERLAVAFETRDQEQEHSCFSDTTHFDLRANQAGIVAILTGQHDDARFGPGLLGALRPEHDALALNLMAKVSRVSSAMHAIPAPFDRAYLGDDAAPGRRAIQAALDALDAQTDAIAIVGRALGYKLPLAPGG